MQNRMTAWPTLQPYTHWTYVVRWHFCWVQLKNYLVMFQKAMWFRWKSAGFNHKLKIHYVSDIRKKLTLVSFWTQNSGLLSESPAYFSNPPSSTYYLCRLLTLLLLPHLTSSFVTVIITTTIRGHCLTTKAHFWSFFFFFFWWEQAQ